MNEARLIFIPESKNQNLTMYLTDLILINSPQSHWEDLESTELNET